ncbi:MAG: O-methyltransferase [Chloroflexota bacterium]|nr:O-methyltransferase [Chloroflexota bacterium]
MADPDSRAGTSYQTPAIEAYLRGLYAAETPGMQDALRSARTAGLPEIQVSPTDGKILEVLLRMVGARKVVELGTLAGYSAQWIIRALPPDGHLWTIERDPKHADVARGVLERAGLADRATVLTGTADELLGALEREAPFDAVFIDADKGGYERYARWALRHLRSGGLVLADNAYLFGYLAGREPDERESARSIRAMRAFHDLLARECDGVVLPTPDGLSVAIKR